jgi:hypothetical protein
MGQKLPLACCQKVKRENYGTSAKKIEQKWPLPCLQKVKSQYYDTSADYTLSKAKKPILWYFTLVKGSEITSTVLSKGIPVNAKIIIFSLSKWGRNDLSHADKRLKAKIIMMWLNKRGSNKIQEITACNFGLGFFSFICFPIFSLVTNTVIFLIRVAYCTIINYFRNRELIIHAILDRGYPYSLRKIIITCKSVLQIRKIFV